MLSSVAGIQGGASQSNYAAGNTFQDAFAHWRRAQGLPALAIDIGYVADVGWTASNADLRRVAQEHRQTPITSQELMTLIEYHVTSWFEISERGGSSNFTAPSAQVAVGLSENLPESALFSHIKASRARVSPAAGSLTQSAKQDSVKVKLDAVGNDKIALGDIIETVLADKLAQLLLLPRENVRLDDTFASHGVDSLVAVEIRSWVGKELEGKLVVSEILTGQATIKDVVKEIVEKRGAA